MRKTYKQLDAECVFDMKLDCVLTACNTNPTYMEFIPIFVKTWNKLYPNVDVKIVLISHVVPPELCEYTANIILYPPLDGISTAFISQYIRLLYPAILNYDNGIMITDMDMLPMNRTYYTSNIQNVDDDKFVYLRSVLLHQRQIAMCYNVARNTTWGDIFSISTIEDIHQHIRAVYSRITYVDGHNKAGWSTDQCEFYKYVMKWNNRTNKMVVFDDAQTAYKRLDRAPNFNLSTTMILRIQTGKFSDYHCCRPYSKYKDINDKIVDLL